MNQANVPPPARLNAQPAPPWKTYSQRARALNIPLRPIQRTGLVDSNTPTRPVTPFGSLSLNARVPQYISPLIRPGGRYVSNLSQPTAVDHSSSPDEFTHLENNPFPSPVASTGDFIVPRSSDTEVFEATPTKPQSKGLPDQANGIHKSKNEITLSSSSEGDVYEGTPTKPSAFQSRPGVNLNKKNEIDLAGTSEPDPAQAITQGGPILSKTSSMRELAVSFTLFLQKGAETSKVTAKAKKATYTSIHLPSTKTKFDTKKITLAGLKSRLFLLASEIDPTDDDKKGNKAILKFANARNLVRILGIVKGHDQFGKGKFAPIKSNANLVRFFSAVGNCPQKESGFTVTMENPQKAAQEAEEVSNTEEKSPTESTKQNRNVPTTAVDMARCVPKDQEDVHLKALQLRHSSMKTGNNEGYRIFNPKDFSQKMDLSYRQLLIWAKYLAEGIHGVTIGSPPANHADYEEMQGTHINIDYDTLHSIQNFHTLDDYLRFCDFDADTVEQIGGVLLEYRVTSFESFLFPEIMNAREVQQWGILWPMVMVLFTHPRRFYQLVIEQKRMVSMAKDKMKGPLAQAHAIPVASTSAGSPQRL
ncbi:hypothetical protein DFH28DRAFT_1126188 [Melampsora americana]|nr:hypothetical protein DFH28DRAFT_1126188 [Melampsora americana]